MKKLLLILCCFVSISAWTQKTTRPPKPLTFGDKCPDFIFQNIINSPYKSAKLSSFRGKLVILDFMGTYCSSCIKALPELDSLQRALGDKMQILAVTAEELGPVKNLLTRPFMQGNSLPFIIKDRTISAYFPHQYLPHEVWIDGAGIVRAITSGQYLTAKNIEAVLKGEKPGWPVKKDREPLAAAIPLMVPNPAAQPVPGPLYYSTFSPAIDGMLGNAEKVVDSAAGTITCYMKNRDIVPLYISALKYMANRKVSLTTKNLLVEVADSSRIFYNSSVDYLDQWERKNSFCFEAALPLNLPVTKRAEWVVSDLNRYLGLHAGFERRTINCWVIKGRPGAVKSRNEKTANNRSKRLPISTIGELAKRLNYNPHLPVIMAETGEPVFLREAVEISNLYDKQALQDFLGTYNLYLEEEKREWEVFVIKD